MIGRHILRKEMRSTLPQDCLQPMPLYDLNSEATPQWYNILPSLWNPHVAAVATRLRRHNN